MTSNPQYKLSFFCLDEKAPYDGLIIAWRYEDHYAQYRAVGLGNEVTLLDGQPEEILRSALEVFVKSGKGPLSLDTFSVIEHSHKWDGCGNLLIGPHYLHFCTAEHYIRFIGLLKLCYQKAYELMGRDTGEDEDADAWGMNYSINGRDAGLKPLWLDLNYDQDFAKKVYKKIKGEE